MEENKLISDNFEQLISEFADSGNEADESSKEITGIDSNMLLKNLKRMNKVTIKWIGERNQVQKKVFNQQSTDWDTFFPKLKSKEQNNNMSLFTSAHGDNQVWSGGFTGIDIGFMEFWRNSFLGENPRSQFRLNFETEVEFFFERSGKLRISVLTSIPDIVRMWESKKTNISLDIGAARYEIYFDPEKRKFVFELNSLKACRDPYGIFKAYLPVTWANTEIFLTILLTIILLGGGVAGFTLMALMLNPVPLAGILGAVLFYGSYVASGLSIVSGLGIGISQINKHKNRYKYLFDAPKPWEAIKLDLMEKVSSTDSKNAAQVPQRHSVFSSSSGLTAITPDGSNSKKNKSQRNLFQV